MLDSCVHTRNESTIEKTAFSWVSTAKKFKRKHTGEVFATVSWDAKASSSSNSNLAEFLRPHVMLWTSYGNYGAQFRKNLVENCRKKFCICTRMWDLGSWRSLKLFCRSSNGKFFFINRIPQTLPFPIFTYSLVRTSSLPVEAGTHIWTKWFANSSCKALGKSIFIIFLRNPIFFKKYSKLFSGVFKISQLFLKQFLNNQ